MTWHARENGECEQIDQRQWEYLTYLHVNYPEPGMVGGFGVATRLKSGEILVTGCVCEGGNVYVLLDLWTDPNATKQTAQLAFGLLARSLVVGGTH